MTREEAIEVLRKNRPTSDPRPCGMELCDAVDIAISALRKQENECVECSGIVYRQTNSGKIVPLGQRCGAKITPPCYVPDGDGCSYQIYGDNNDEPIDRCKSCPLCQSDKARHKQETVTNRNGLNEPLTLDDLREAAQTGDPVWLVRANCSSWVVIEKVDDRKYIQLVDYAEFGSDEPYDFAISDYGDSFKAYRQKPEEGTV